MTTFDSLTKEERELRSKMRNLLIDAFDLSPGEAAWAVLIVVTIRDNPNEWTRLFEFGVDFFNQAIHFSHLINEQAMVDSGDDGEEEDEVCDNEPS